MSSIWWVGEDDLFEEQLAVLDLAFDENLLILGPPGSGKTNLLLLRANHLHIAEQSEFYIIAYTALLSTFIKTGADLYSFPLNKVITQTRLYEMVLGDHGVDIKRDGKNFQEYQNMLREYMQHLMKSGIGKHSFPMLFVDEAQDYDSLDLSIFLYLGKSVCFSADPRQGIYADNGNNVDWLINQCPEVVRLKYHFRTGKKILEVADRIMDGKFGHVSMLSTSQYKEEELPSSVEVQGSIPLDIQVSRAAERLVFQLKAYPNEKLGVLVPRKQELQQVWEFLLKEPGLDGKVTNAQLNDFDPSCPIWLSTIHSAKGLEFRSAHIIASDEISKFNAHARRLAFTATTRAKTVLIVYYFRDLLPFLASALAKKNTAPIKVGDLFGKKK